MIVVASPGEWDAAWELGNFDVRFLPEPVDSDVLSSADCVAIVFRDREQVAAAVRAVETARRDTPLAMVLAGPAETKMDAVLAEHEFDGFVDISWPASVARACMRTAIRHAQVDRNVLEIQRTVLECSRDETERLYELASHDDLTGLYTRRHLLDQIAREHERARRQGTYYGLAFIDLDDLKRINTEHGHAAGSRVLRALSETLTLHLRASDMAGRVGGDELVVLLAGCTKLGASLFAERFRAAVESLSIDVGPRSVRATVSIGVAAFPDDGLDHAEVMENADRRLFTAKARGKNCSVTAE